MSFICIIIENHFYINGFALSLVLKVRFFGTRKWPILWELNSFLMQTLSFVSINLQRCWPREWKNSILWKTYSTQFSKNSLSKHFIESLTHSIKDVLLTSHHQIFSTLVSCCVYLVVCLKNVLLCFIFHFCSVKFRLTPYQVPYIPDCLDMGS